MARADFIRVWALCFSTKVEAGSKSGSFNIWAGLGLSGQKAEAQHGVPNKQINLFYYYLYSCT